MSVPDTDTIIGQLKRISWVLAIAGIVLAMVLAGKALLTTELKEGNLTQESLSSYYGNWEYTDGKTTEEVRLDDYVVYTTEKSFTLTTTVTADELEKLYDDGNTFLFYNNHYGISVFLEGREIYSSNLTDLSNQVSAAEYVIFSVPEEADGVEISITFSKYKNGVCQVPNLQIGTRYAVLTKILKDNIISIICFTFMIIAGVCLVAVAVFFACRRVRDRRILTLGVFLLLAAVWTYTDSTVTSLTCIQREIMEIAGHVSLMMLPIPVLFFAKYTINDKNPAFRWMVFATELNICGQLVCCITGLFTLNRMVIVSQAVIGISIVACLAVCIREMFLRRKDPILHHMIIALSFVTLASVASLLIYWKEKTQGEGLDRQFNFATLLSVSMCILFILFFIIVVVSYINKIQKHRVEEEKITIYEDLALKDSMTGLFNRRAFENRLTEFDENPIANPDAVLIILDLNGLKKINDEQGHAVGDEAIVAVAKAIKKVYDIHGEGYRIGGDEFAAIITDLSIDVRALNRQFDTALDKYNDSAAIRISVAKGSCDLYDGMGRRYNTVEWKQNADTSMYADKKAGRSNDAVKRAEDLQSILETVIGLVEAKDQYTANHSERVRELSVMIAGWMNLSPQTIEQIDLAAHLHDIGKVGVPEHILLKPSRLTDEEFAEMKKHPVIGAKVIERARNMSEISAIVLHHHERYDGKGYPDGIAGEEIPLGARVVALADSIDAMTSKRCYRDSLGIDVCRDEIERNLSKMYDPVIGNIVLEHWNEISETVLRG